MAKKKVVLAFSGGLDTSFCVKYLSEEKGFDVHSVIVNTGGFSREELDRIAENAEDLGVKKHVELDEIDNYYNQCIRYLIYGNVLKNNTYPLSVSAERVFQAKALAEYARKIEADYIAHGSTGAGNDQVRFDVIFRILLPDTEIITPIRDLGLSRQEEVEYLKKQGVQRDWSESAYSINQGLWGTTVGGRETLTSDQPLPEDQYPYPATAHEPRDLTLKFENGELKGIENESFENPVDAIIALENIAAPYGIGRDIHVGDTVIGIKGRVGFQAAAPLLIIKAHHLLEKHTLTKWQLQLKEQLSSWYGMLLHDGQFLEPAMRDIEHFLESTQQYVSGEVIITLHPNYFEMAGVRSDHDMMSGKFGSYGEENKAWTGEDVKGFSKIFSNSTMIHKMVNDHG